jgi:predicted helicase
MSLQLIQQYYTKVEKLIQYGGSKNETAIRSAFQTLLEQYCIDKNLLLVLELEYKTKYETTVKPDATLKDALRQDWGYWESKDTFDSLDNEIQSKIQKGYPTTNIMFEDSQTAVLIQNGTEVSRADFKNANALHTLLTEFVNYEPREVQTFREAIEKFKADLPDLITELRQLIEKQAQDNTAFAKARADFLELCRESINPHIVMADIREMLIQHILTEDIFITIFSNAQFHQENNIASELATVVKTFFTGAIRQNILIKIDPYIKIIKAAASNIYDHHEKQRFLKVVYENFYKAYNPAGADRLGIIYTPNEIVRFMVEAADYLTNKYFGRGLADKNVEILDPATGTGTFITELIEYLPNNLLPYKYENEIHCNEVAILPYYIANLNIEYTYAQKMGSYAEFKNICFVDTLENLGFDYKNKQYDLLSISADNLERIKRQNERKISVIIGNPPYNANQLNENENNKNRPYPKVDRRIKETYIKYSTAQKTKLYDMYSRFIRWASDRLAPNGVIAFVSNNSFVDKKTYDGFRKVVADEFNEIYVIDMKGDARTSGERRRREGGNVFSDQIRVGVAVYFLVRKQGAEGCQIFYNCVDDYMRAEAKKAYLRDNKFQQLPFVHIQPDIHHNWINLDENDWDKLMPVASKETKLTKKTKNEEAIFKLVSLGVSTNRDEWVYDLSGDSLIQKIQFFIKNFNAQCDRLTTVKESELDDQLDYSIKWSDALKQRLLQKKKLKLNKDLVIKLLRRPFVAQLYYSEKGLSDRLTSNHFDMFGQTLTMQNIVIAINIGNKPFNVISSKYLVDLHFNGDSQCLPLYRYDEKGNRYDNITGWALSEFQEHYQDKTIGKEAIFHYVYGVLHHPAYRKKYETNLKREFPRIPFYDGFWKWSALGKQLMDMHLNFETAALYPIKRIDMKVKTNKLPITPKAKLKPDKAASIIELDNLTVIKGIPFAAWEYKLGNRSALEWLLEYYKERKPKDPTIFQKFNTYRFADNKDQVIDLLARVCTVSVETMKIIGEMGSISNDILPSN